MIAFLEGSLAVKTATSIVLNVGGVGFTMGMSGNSLAKMPELGETVLVHTHMQVREDAITLFGFATSEEKELFERLINVSGVGPKVALAALSSFTPSVLASAITAGDVVQVSRIPGVGKKTAQRIVLELQGKLDVESQLAVAEGSVDGATVRSVVEDLLSMGFTSAEADIALRGAPVGESEAKMLQYALKRLGA